MVDSAEQVTVRVGDVGGASPARGHLADLAQLAEHRVELGCRNLYRGVLGSDELRPAAVRSRQLRCGGWTRGGIVAILVLVTNAQAAKRILL